MDPKEYTSILQERIDRLETQLREVDKARNEDHMALTEIHNVLVKDGFIGKVKANMEAIRSIEDRHIRQDATTTKAILERTATRLKVTTAISLTSMVMALAALIAKWVIG